MPRTTAAIVVGGAVLVVGGGGEACSGGRTAAEDRAQGCWWGFDQGEDFSPSASIRKRKFLASVFLRALGLRGANPDHPDLL